ncbi:hypothetical protein V4C53_35190 [Paraburkholderia azotifigens]|uniref:hypothetical protein n=1 Tax=Paraburkholderia azotifigens TaxID=2057004 RepID=UPI00317A28A4
MGFAGRDLQFVFRSVERVADRQFCVFVMTEPDEPCPVLCHHDVEADFVSHTTRIRSRQTYCFIAFYPSHNAFSLYRSGRHH